MHMEGDIYTCCICHNTFVDVAETHTITCLECIKKHCTKKSGYKGACYCCENRNCKNKNEVEKSK